MHLYLTYQYVLHEYTDDLNIFLSHFVTLKTKTEMLLSYLWFKLLPNSLGDLLKGKKPSLDD